MPCRKRQWAKRPLEREDWLLRPSRATDRQKRLWASLLARLAERRLHELGARRGGWQADDNPIPPISAHGKSLLAAYRGRPLRACRDIGTGAAMARRQWAGRETLACPLAVEITFYPPDRRKRDLDNLPKSLFDSLTDAGVWKDDSLIQDLRTRWGPRTGEARAVVKITNWRIKACFGNRDQKRAWRPNKNQALCGARKAFCI